MAISDIDVSVYILTYFHEKYISQAMESVLSQKTRFRYEIVISDDCSRDRTTDILRDYERRYPDIIRVNINEENMGIAGNIYKARSMCRGRYCTVLAGDDYWINDDKLENQVSFLEEHPDYIAVFNAVEVRMDDETHAYDVVPRDPRMRGREYTIADYERCVPLPEHGFVMRNFFLTQEGRDYFAQAREISPYVDDAVDPLLILMKGRAYVMDIVSDVHRVVRSGGTNNNYNSRYSKLEKYKHHIELANNLDSRWGDEIDFSNWYARFYAMGIEGIMPGRNHKEYRHITSTIPAKYKKPFNKSIYIKAIPHICKLIAARCSRVFRQIDRDD